jgi:hypothetical protein
MAPLTVLATCYERCTAASVQIEVTTPAPTGVLADHALGAAVLGRAPGWPITHVAPIAVPQAVEPGRYELEIDDGTVTAIERVGELDPAELEETLGQLAVHYGWPPEQGATVARRLDDVEASRDQLTNVTSSLEQRVAEVETFLNDLIVGLNADATEGDEA